MSNLWNEREKKDLRRLHSNQEEARKKIWEIIPPHKPKPSIVNWIKKGFAIASSAMVITLSLVVLGGIGFVGFKAIGNFETFWHHLTKNRTIAVSLSDQKVIQDSEIDAVLSRLTASDNKTLKEKLIELSLDGYEEQPFSAQSLIVYDEKDRDRYRDSFEQFIKVGIRQAYQIYDNFSPQIERSVYGITADELVYQKGLKIDGYAPMSLKNTIYFAHRYFPFALIASHLSGVDPLRLLMIFEIESNFTETAVHRNTARSVNDDIGIAQNNLVMIPGLIRDILNPNNSIHSPYFEFLEIGVNPETGDQLSWSDYLIGLESELDGTYDTQIDPTGNYYINLLKAPHIGAILAAFHIKRDQKLKLFDLCLDFYTENGEAISSGLELDKNLNPFHWTDYTFYNGGPKRWMIVRRYLELLEKNEEIATEIKMAVHYTKNRNVKAQRIAEKNDHLRGLIYDLENCELIKNDNLSPNGLFDFSLDFEGRSVIYDLTQELAYNGSRSSKKG